MRSLYLGIAGCISLLLGIQGFAWAEKLVQCVVPGILFVIGAILFGMVLKR